MANDTSKMTREERLAAKLRENLRRRKAQDKSQARDASAAQDETLPKTGGQS